MWYRLRSTLEHIRRPRSDCLLKIHVNVPFGYTDLGRTKGGRLAADIRSKFSQPILFSVFYSTESYACDFIIALMIV